MANYSNSDFKRYGPQRAAEQATKIALVKNPAKGDTFAAFAAKIIAQDDLELADWTFAAVGEDLRVRIAAKTGLTPTGTALATDDLSVAVFDDVGEAVYFVQDAVDRVIAASPDTVTIPQLEFFIREMTAV